MPSVNRDSFDPFSNDLKAEHPGDRNSLAYETGDAANAILRRRIISACRAPIMAATLTSLTRTTSLERLIRARHG